MKGCWGMCKVIYKLSRKMNLPVWWVKAIAVEYTDCREYGVGNDGIWKFNFNKINETELENALINNKTVISSCIIIHNMRNEVFSTRIIEKLVSAVPAPLTTESNNGVVEGLASEYNFPVFFNGYDIVDPKQNLNSYFLVYENGELWQWAFADFLSVEGRNYGKYVSNYVSLEEFDLKDEKYNNLCREMQSDNFNDTFMRNKIVEYFDWIDNIRKPLLIKLYELHQQKKVSPNYKSKATKGIPPHLSKFESYKIDIKKQSNYYLYKVDTSPIFYQSCCQHVTNANKITSSIGSVEELPSRLDAIYQEKASAIVIGIMCVEAFINHIGYDMLPDIWESKEKLRLIDKIKTIFSLKGTGSSNYNKSIEPYSTLSDCIKSRNWLVHSKPKYEIAKNYKQKTMTPIEYYLRDDLVSQVPLRIKELIEFICKDIKVNAPAWLYEAPGWSLD